MFMDAREELIFKGLRKRRQCRGEIDALRRGGKWKDLVEDSRERWWGMLDFKP